jgi:hypothetical protein
MPSLLMQQADAQYSMEAFDKLPDSLQAFCSETGANPVQVMNMFGQYGGRVRKLPQCALSRRAAEITIHQARAFMKQWLADRWDGDPPPE